jgi:FixJ family two-component response regulator
MDNATFVTIVDDDVSMRRSLPDLVETFGFSARAFASAGEFLASDCVGLTKCLILDFAMPGMSGGEQDLRRQLLAAGAVECLFKPFSAAALLEALSRALAAN